MPRVIYIFFLIDTVMPVSNPNSKFHRQVLEEFHPESFVIQQKLGLDMKLLRPKVFHSVEGLSKRIVCIKLTFPLFNSSNDVGISENSLGDPYKLIQQGPNVGKKPLKNKPIKDKFHIDS